MDLKTKKQLTARMLGVGKERVVFNEEKLEDIKEALTKEDIRALIKQGSIKINPMRGVSRSRFRARLSQKRKGRLQGKGSRKGIRTARLSDKKVWINRIRAQRAILKTLKDNGKIETEDFKNAYYKAKGGFYRSKRHLKSALEETKVIKNEIIPKKTPRKN